MSQSFKTLRFFSAFLLVCQLFSVPAAFADETTAPAETPASESPSQAPQTTEVQSSVQAEAQVQPPAVSGGTAEVTETAQSGNVTVDFKDADIQNVLRILSFKSGVNIVAGKDVTGSVTIRLVDVPWEKALDVVLKTYGYAYDRDENIIRVTTLEALKKEELSTEVYVLNYSMASEIEKAVKDVLSERGKMRSDPRSNTLIVTDMPTSLQSVSKVVARLDRQTPQVVIQAKVIEMTLGDADRMGIKWNLKATIAGSARPTTFPFPAKQRTWLYRFLPEGRASASTTTVGSGGVTANSTDADFPSSASQPSFPVADKDEFLFGTLNFSEFQMMLELISERTDSKILSEPHVTTLNNQEAKILVGEVISIPTFERNSTTGRMEITGYSDRDLGIRLSVTPQVNSENEIVVNIHPEITNLLGYDDLTPDIKAPRFSTREAKTQVRIRNGQTIAIGGLIRENVIDQNTKIPILGDLPLLDRIFSHKDKSIVKTDLLFFMTVNVVDEQRLPQGHKA